MVLSPSDTMVSGACDGGPGFGGAGTGGASPEVANRITSNVMTSAERRLRTPTEATGPPEIVSGRSCLVGHPTRVGGADTVIGTASITASVAAVVLSTVYRRKV